MAGGSTRTIGPEGGARVRVVLPVKDSTRSATGARANAASSCGGKGHDGPHILVVDDEADIRGLLKEILSEEGYEVDVAANAAQARASRVRQTPDLVLLDIWMPDVDGISLLREWSACATDGCPVVMMSGHGTVETAVEATRLGAFDFVEKPLSLAKLLRTVERALDAGKRRRQSGKLLAPALTFRLERASDAAASHGAAANRVNPSSVLLVGEPGSGREAFARYLHERGPRAGQPFVTLLASSLREARRREPLVRARGRATAARRRRAGGSGRGHTVYSRGRGSARVAQRLLVGVLESGQFTPHRWYRAGAPAPRGCCRRRNPVSRIGRSRSVAARPAGAPQHADRARAAAARLRRGRARSCCATMSIEWWTPRDCRSGGSAWLRRTGCATTRGRTTCAS